MHIKRYRTNAVAASTLIIGTTLLTLGVNYRTLPETIAGGVLTFCAAIGFSLHAVHRWIVDTSDERRSLLEATMSRDAERAKYVAGRYATQEEHKRIRLAAVAAARRADEQLQAERAALHATFEEKRNELVSRTTEAALRMAIDGGLLDEQRAPVRQRVVVPFPQQPADYERARGRDASS